MSKMSKLSVTMRQKYQEMIERRFEPILATARQVENRLEEGITREVRKELGIYELHQEKVALELRLKEIEEQMDKYEGGQHRYRSDSLVYKEVQRRLEERSTVIKSLEEQKRSLIDQIWLMGESSGLQEIFRKIDDEIIPKLAAQVSETAISVETNTTDIKKLPVKTSTRKNGARKAA